MSGILVFGNMIKPRNTWEEKFSLEIPPPSDWPVDMSVWHFLGGWLTWKGPAHSEHCHLWAGGPELDKKAHCVANQGKQGRKQGPSKICAPSLRPCFLK